jgi:3-oxoacyl-(acyl-carrier-protein) synthase
MKRRRAAVTGLGIITAVGCDAHAFWENLLKGVEVAFSNFFAFGDNNTTLVFGKWK